MLAAWYPAPKPLSILTVEIPGAHEFNIVRNALNPSRLAPYPTDVGKAIIGALTKPAKTLGRAPSIPATTTITLALEISGNLVKSLCIPATPT